MAFDLGDIASRYASARFDQATQPFTDPEAYMNNRLQQDFGVDMNGNVKPRSTTITNNDNGTQTVTQKHEITPAEVQAQPVAAPVNPQSFEGIPAAPQMAQLPQPGPGVQVAGPMTMPPAPTAPTAPVPTVEQLAEQERAKAQASMPAAPVAPTAVAQQPSTTVAPSGSVTSEPNTPPTAPIAPNAMAPMPAAPVNQAVNAVPPNTAQATGAVPRPMMQAINDLHSIQSDPAKLASYYGNESNSPEARKLAAAMYKDHITTEDRAQKAEQQLKDSVTTGDFLPLMKEIKSKKEEGSYLKAILFARLGLNDLAKEEQQKLGAGNKYEVATSANGIDQALIQYNGDGLAMKGFKQDGTALTPKELAGYAAGAMSTKAHLMPSVHGTPVLNAQGEGGLRMYDPKTRETYVQVGKERRPDTGWTLPTQNVQNVYAASGAGQQGKQAAEGYTNQPLATYPGGGAPAGSQGGAPAQNAVQVASQLGVPVISGVRDTARQQQLYDESVRAGRTGFMANGNPIAKPGTSAHETAMGVDIDTAKLTPQQRQALEASGLRQPMPQQDPNHWEMKPQAGAPAGTPVYQQRLGAEVGKKSTEELNTANRKYSDELADSRKTALPQRATIDRLQTAIDKNPNFWGIDTNSSAWRAFVDVNSSNENKAESLNTLARNLNIPSDKRAAFDQTMNDYRALQVNAITGSGLTASQTNTERESQRVMGTIGSISDKPAAAKATLEYAKAKIEYADAKAKAWVTAHKQNPNISRNEFEINFDETKGEQIFKDVNDRMSKIIGAKPTGGPVAPGASQEKTVNGVTYYNDGQGWKEKR